MALLVTPLGWGKPSVRCLSQDILCVMKKLDEKLLSSSQQGPKQRSLSCASNTEIQSFRLPFLQRNIPLEELGGIFFWG